MCVWCGGRIEVMAFKGTQFDTEECRKAWAEKKLEQHVSSLPEE